MVAGPGQLAVPPRRVAGAGRPRAGDRDEVVGVAVDGEHRAANGVGEGVVAVGPNGEREHRAQLPGAPAGGAGPPSPGNDGAGVERAVAGEVERRHRERAARPRRREEAAREHDRVDPGRLGASEPKRPDAPLRVADEHHPPRRRRRRLDPAEPAERRRGRVPPGRGAADAGQADHRPVGRHGHDLRPR